jgi:hypothetical protein
MKAFFYFYGRIFELFPGWIVLMGRWKKTVILVVAFPFDLVKSPGGYEPIAECITY